MGNVRELESRQERVIFLNQEFHPFEGQKRISHEILQVPSYKTNILLTCTPLEIPIEIAIWQIQPSKPYSENEVLRFPNWVTPFEPKEGYSISIEDYSIEERVRKLKLAYKSLENNALYFSERPFLLGIFSEEGKLSRHKVTTPAPWGRGGHIFPKDTPLKRLKMQIKANGCYFETTLDTYDFISGSFHNSTGFYPMDGGPLPKDFNLDYSPVDHEGVSLAFSDDPEKLASIKMKFVLAKDPNESEVKTKRSL